MAAAPASPTPNKDAPINSRRVKAPLALRVVAGLLLTGELCRFFIANPSSILRMTCSGSTPVRWHADQERSCDNVGVLYHGVLCLSIIYDRSSVPTTTGPTRTQVLARQGLEVPSER